MPSCSGPRRRAIGSHELPPAPLARSPRAPWLHQRPAHSAPEAVLNPGPCPQIPQGLGWDQPPSGKVGSQPASSSPKWWWPCPWTPAERSQAEMSLDVIPAKTTSSFLTPFAVWSLEANSLTLTILRGPVYIMWVQGRARLISSSITERCLWEIKLSGIWTSPRIHQEVKGRSFYLLIFRGGILDC